MLPIGGVDTPPRPWTTAPKDKTFLVVEKKKLNQRTDSSQEHAGIKTGNGSVHTYTNPAQLTLLERHLLPTRP